MIAANNEHMMEATQALYEYNSDYVIRQKCEAREEYECRQRTMKRLLNEAQEKLQEKEAALREKDVALREQEAALQEKDVALQEQEAALQAKDAEIARLLELIEKNKK